LYQGVVVIGKQSGACSPSSGCLHTHCYMNKRRFKKEREKKKKKTLCFFYTFFTKKL